MTRSLAETEGAYKGAEDLLHHADLPPHLPFTTGCPHCLERAHHALPFSLPPVCRPQLKISISIGVALPDPPHPATNDSTVRTCTLTRENAPVCQKDLEAKHQSLNPGGCAWT